jgi:acyl carrier protein
MADLRNVEDQLSRLFAEKLNVEVPSVETDLIDTGLVDSLTFVEFLAQLEAEFGVRVSLEDLEIDRFRTISSIAGFIATKTAQLTLASNHGRP